MRSLMPSPSGNERLYSLEIGRGLAALAVVIFHANSGSRMMGGYYSPVLSVLEHGIDFFFVLSGFIIYTAHADAIGRPNEIVSYLKKRFIRLFPLLWIVVLGYAALNLVKGDSISADLLVRSLIPYPSLEKPAPEVIWTLRHELMFYMIFALAVWRPRLGWPAMALWLLGTLLQSAALIFFGHGLGGALSLVFSSFTLDFMIGIGLAMLHRGRNVQRGFTPLIVALILLCCVLWAAHHFGLKRNGFADYTSLVALFWTPVMGLAFAVVVYGLLCIEHVVKPDNRLIALGSASYAIYLAHTPIMGVMLHFTRPLVGTLIHFGAAQILLVVGGVLSGFVLHYRCERPMTIWLRRKMLAPNKK